WGRLAVLGLPQEPDVNWILVAGRDPAEEIRAMAGRCPIVHAKDMRQKADGEGEDVIAGDGEIDWPAVAAAAAAAGAEADRGEVAERIVVERDNPAEHPVDDVALSLATLRDALP